MFFPVILLIAGGFYLFGSSYDDSNSAPDSNDGESLPDPTPDEPSQFVDNLVIDANEFLSPVHEDLGIMNKNMRMSASGLNTLKTLEGFSARAYPDHKGYSIGYGHLIRNGDGLSKDDIISPEKGLMLLADDVRDAENAVNSAINVSIDQNQFDALTSFCYNVGIGAFKSSTLVRKINAGDDTASDEFARWNKASGKVNNSLVARREIEKDLYLS